MLKNPWYICDRICFNQLLIILIIYLFRCSKELSQLRNFEEIFQEDRVPSNLRLALDLGTDMAENGHQNNQGAGQKVPGGFSSFLHQSRVKRSECKESKDKWQVWKFWTTQLQSQSYVTNSTQNLFVGNCKNIIFVHQTVCKVMVK